MLMKVKKIHPLIIAASILALGIVFSVFILMNQQRKEFAQRESLRNRYKLCLADAELWYVQNAEALPRFCEQEKLNDNECNKLLESNLKGREKKRGECNLNFQE